MEAVEGAAALSPVGERQGEAAGSEPPPIEHAERSGKREKALPSPPRGSSLRNFFWCSCDRPGCYEEFERTRRSPLQRLAPRADPGVFGASVAPARPDILHSVFLSR